MRVPIILLACVAASTAFAQFATIDDFQGLALDDNINGQNGWTAIGTQLVKPDPVGGGNQVLRVYDDVKSIYKAATVSDPDTGTLFFRFRVPSGETPDVCVSLSDPAGISGTYPGTTTFRVATSSLMVYDGGWKTVSTGSWSPDTWYSVWLVAGTASDTWQAYLKGGSGGYQTLTQVKHSTSDNTFAFRSGTGAVDLAYAFIRTNSGHAGNQIFVDDLSLDATAQNLAVPDPTDLLSNGDFERVPFPSGWSGTAASAHRGLTPTGLDSALTNAAYLKKTGDNQLYQYVTSDPWWTLDMVLAAEDPGAGTRSFNMTVFHSGGMINMRLGPDGKLYVYDGSSWQKLSDETVTFSVDGNGDNSFDDPEDTLHVHTLRIVGDYRTTPFYDVYLSEVDSTLLRQIASGVAWFQYAAPSAGAGINQLRFATGASDGDYLVDQVSLHNIPEPTTLVLLAFGAAGLRRRIRRRRK